MQKLVFCLLLLLASLRAGADDLCMTVTSDPDNRPPDRDYRRIVAPLPVYPSSALTEGSDGFVDVEFEVTTAGTVRDPIVVISVPPGLFDEAALEGALKFRYKPRIVDGEPVAVAGVPTRISFSMSAPDKREEQKPARQKQAQAVSKAVYLQIEKVQELVDAQDYDGALRILNRLYNPDKLTEYEQVNVLNYQALVYYNMDDIPNAMRAYERQLLIPSLEPQTAKQTTYTLAQLYTVEEQYQTAMSTLDKLLVMETDHPPEPYILYAQNLYQVKRFRDMIKLIETAIRIAEKHKKPVKEDWYRLLRYANSAIEEFQNAVDISKEMNKRWPSEENFHALAIIYTSLKDRNKAITALRELLAGWPESDYVTPFHVAAADGDTALVTELLANGTDVNLQSRHDWTPLHSAGQFGQVETTEILINAKADVNAKTTIDLTVLHLAAQEGFPLIVEMLISAGADVNARNTIGFTALHLAARKGFPLIVEMLISAGADVNAKTMKDFTVLHQAAQKGFPLIVEMLIAAGAAVNAVSNAETPPLLGAVVGNHISVVEALIAAGADVNAKNKANLTVLHSAAENSEAPMVEMLIAAGADVNAKSEIGMSVLHVAAGYGRASIVELLISAGADVNAKSEKGSTPLHLPAKIGNAAVVEILIAAGADLNAKTEFDWTPLSFAASSGHTTLATHLIDQGATVAGMEIVAESGYASAQFLLGSLYAQGLGVRRNYSRAVDWYRAAAEQNNADAAYALGELYLDGSGIKSDAKQVAQWFQAAAYQGHRNAQMKLSELYQNGVGVAKDPTEASMWSCLAGVYRAQKF